MSTWDSKSVKPTPVVGDEVLIIDTQDSRNQKRATLSTLPYLTNPFTANVDGGTFNLTNLTLLESTEVQVTRTDPAGAFVINSAYSNTADGSPHYRSNRSRGTPGGETSVMNNDVLHITQVRGWGAGAFRTTAWMQVMATEPYTADEFGSEFRFYNTESGTNTPALNLAILNDGTLALQNNNLMDAVFSTGITVAQSLTWTPGQKQTLSQDATNSGFNLGTVGSDPSTLADGDVWFVGGVQGRLKYYFSTVTQVLVTQQSTDTLTNKTLGAQTFFSVAPTINDGVKFLFNPDNTNAGINVGENGTDPSSPANGDLYYQTSVGLRAYVEGAWETISTLVGGIASINGDTTAAQLIQGTTNVITVGTAAGTTTINTGSLVPLTNIDNTFTGENTFEDFVYVEKNDPAGSIVFIETQTNVAANSATLRTQRARDSAGSPDAVTTGDTVGLWESQGFGDSEFQNSGRAEFIAEGTFTASNAPASFNISTTPTSSVTPVLNFSILSNGNADFHNNDLVNVDQIFFNATNNTSFILATGTYIGVQIDGIAFRIENTTVSLFSFSDSGADFNLLPVIDTGVINSHVYSNNTDDGSIHYLDRSRGTLAGPLNVQAGNLLGAILARGRHDGSTFVDNGGMEIRAAENFGPVNAPTQINFKTTPSGTVNPSVRLIIDENGNTSFEQNNAKNIAPPVEQDDGHPAIFSTSISGVKFIEPVKMATTTSGNLATDFENGDTIDGVDLETADRILIKNQSLPAENGVYTVNVTGAPTRATDADSSAELEGIGVYVTQGTANGGQSFLQIRENITVNSDPIVFFPVLALTNQSRGYMKISQPDSPFTVTIATIDTYVQVNQATWTDPFSANENFTLNGGSGTLTYDGQPRRYKVTIWNNANDDTGAAQMQDVVTAVFVNSTVDTNSEIKNSRNGGSSMKIFYIDLATNDVLDMRVKNVEGDDDLEISDIGIELEPVPQVI